jgi:DNA helicase-2/ATP-dependent DNA helicase PcrA
MSGTTAIQAFDPTSDGYGAPAPETLLIGPPGTGKTRAVLEAWLVPALHTLRPHEVLATSFTVAAATEMRERLAKATGLHDRDLFSVCKTTHSEALRLVRVERPGVAIWKPSMAPKGGTLAAAFSARDAEEAEEARRHEEAQLLTVQGPPPAPPTPDVEDRWEAMAKPCAELGAEAIRLWGLARCIWPRDAHDIPRMVERVLVRTESRFRNDEITAEIRRLEAMKAAAGAVDFTDMLILALDLPAPRRSLLIVDEAQDLSPLQILLVEHWASSAEHLVWVGDPDQGIFAFAGADGAHLTALIRSGGIAVRSLQRSWRVPAMAHRLARAIILRNADRVDAPYAPADRPGEGYEIRQRGAGVDPDAVSFLETMAEGGSVFLLARTNARLGEYGVELAEAGIPYRAERGSSPLQLRSMLDALLAIRGLQARRRIGADQARALHKLIPGRPRHAWLLGKKGASESALKALDNGAQLDAGDLVRCGVDADAIEACGTVEEALRAIGRLEEAEPLLRIVRHADGDWGVLTRPPTITLTNLHCSKGREARAVLLDLACPRKVRSELVRGKAGAVEEERRLLYVGLTRAQDVLGLVRTPDDLGDRLGLVVG